MKGRFEKIEQELANLLNQELLSDIYTFREKRLSHINEIVQEMSNMLSASTGSGTKLFRNVITRGIDRLRQFSEVEEYQTIPDLIVGDIFILKDKLPKRQILNQAPERFQLLQEDDLYIKAGKAVKQLMRSAGKSEWMQRIPFQEVLAYHLLDADWFFEDWISAEERLRMQIILELDQVLAISAKGDLKQSIDTELQQVLKVIQNHIEEAQRLHKQKLIEARDNFIEHFISIFAKVGTFEKMNSFYSENRLLRKRKKTEKELGEYLKKWQAINTQFLERTAALHRFLIFCDGLDQVSEVFKMEIEDAFKKAFYTPSRELENHIAAVRQEAVHSEHNLFTALADNEQQLLKSVGPYFVEPLRESIDESEIQRQIDLYSEQLVKRAEELPEAVVFVIDIDRRIDPPKIKSKEIRWRSLVSQTLKDMLVNKITPDDTNIEKFNYEQLIEAQEIEDIIEANLETAAELRKEQSAGEDPKEILDEGMQRAASKLREYELEAEKTQRALLEPLKEGPAAFKHLMFDLLYRADTEKLTSLDSKYKFSEKTQNPETDAKPQPTDLQNRSAVLSRFYWKKIKKYYQKSSFFLGLKAKDEQEEETADIAVYLSETERRIAELPYVYRRLFDVKAEPDARHYVGLNEHINYIKEVYKQDQNEQSSSLAVVGEKGSGKSTFLSLALSGLFSTQNVVEINVKDGICTGDDLLALFNDQIKDAAFSSIDELAAFFNEKQGRPAIIFEGVQHLYIRNLNGYEAIEHLVDLVMKTSDRIFWMLSCSRYAWAYLDETFNLAGYFSHVIETDRLDEQQIEKIILNRHRASGYELVFASSKSDAQQYSPRKLVEEEEKSQEALKKKYFSRLAKISGGNTSIAMLFWIRSIQKFDDTHCIVVPIAYKSEKIPGDFSSETLFILAALVLHDSLNPEQLASTQNMTLQESRIIFRRLKTRGIITKSNAGFELNHLIYRQVIEELKDRNILHL